MSRPLALALAVCTIAMAVGPLRAQQFDSGLSRLPAPDDPAAQIPPETVPPGSPSPIDERTIVLDDAWPVPGWHIWSPAFWDPWEGNVELGLSGTEGNSQTFNVRFGMTAKHKTPTFVQTLQVTSIQKSADGETTANTALVDGRLEWPMPESRWNYFIHGLWEYDEFKAFNYRVSADTGLGYEFIQTDVTMLMGRTGLSVSHEVGGLENAWNPELLFGGEFKHKFNPTHSVSAKVEYYPTIIDFTDFRLNSWASWEIALSAAWGLSLKLSIIDRYDSTPEGARPNDLDYSTLLLWTF
jgi:putative salt-induced outer membrane protein YdiY